MWLVVYVENSLRDILGLIINIIKINIHFFLSFSHDYWKIINYIGGWHHIPVGYCGPASVRHLPVSLAEFWFQSALFSIILFTWPKTSPFNCRPQVLCLLLQSKVINVRSLRASSFPLLITSRGTPHLKGNLQANLRLVIRQHLRTKERLLMDCSNSFRKVNPNPSVLLSSPSRTWADFHSPCKPFHKEDPSSLSLPSLLLISSSGIMAGLERPP